MKVVKLLPIVFLLITCCTSLEKRMNRNDSDLYIGVYDCFEDDSIKIIINNKEIVDIENLTTDSSLGITGLYIEYFLKSRDKGIIKVGNKKVVIEKEIFIDLKKDISLEIIRNNNSDKFQIDINKGKKIGISGCSDDRKHTKMTYFKRNRTVE
ncbi:MULTISPECIES: hypothetical protein [Flavobacterium]|uniref:Auto-transporter adhesin head GIN domain-containing protein n=1 Tax=Flavobacterium jumunjinense TaxID=998845 RepID=A0ABV5GPW3_9FLAO|nr:MULTISPECIES: hypothetical protein [Flavobacterium]